MTMPTPQELPALTQKQIERIWLDATDHHALSKSAAFALVRSVELAVRTALAQQPAAVAPDGTLHDDGYFTWAAIDRPKGYNYAGWSAPFYLVPPASLPLPKPEAPAYPASKAIEFAEYMANHAEQLIEAINAEDATLMAIEEGGYEDGEGPDLDDLNDRRSNRSDRVTGLRSGIYEFRKRAEKVAATPSVPAVAPGFKLGDAVQKVKGSQWSGRVVGTYSTALTPEGYAVESATHAGSVQIYPAAALVAAPSTDKGQTTFVPNKGCKSVGPCQRAGMCMDSWHCASLATPGTTGASK